MQSVEPTRVELANGLLFDVYGDNRIERALLETPMEVPDHVWEPQTTRLLLALSAGGEIIIGGAFIGDHALPLAQALERRGDRGFVHAFEPQAEALARLRRNIEINGLTQIRVRGEALWDSVTEVVLSGELALASPAESASVDVPGGERVPAETIDGYVAKQGLGPVDLIALDTEGGELAALRGATEILAQPPARAPDVVFEVHRAHVDWSDGLHRTEPVRLLEEAGYAVFAIRDYQGNVDMRGMPIEIVPAASAHLDGPPHGFNLVASKDAELAARIGLRIVHGVSPKLLAHGDPALHSPLG